MSWFSLSGKSNPDATTKRDNITKILEGGVATLCQQGGIDGIRDYLVKNKVAGRRASPRDCVMARYFNALLRENNFRATVGVAGPAVIAYTLGAARDRVSVELPPTVRSLIGRFDSGYYPELDLNHNPNLDGEIAKLLDSELVNA